MNLREYFYHQLCSELRCWKSNGEGGTMAEKEELSPSKQLIYPVATKTSTSISSASGLS
jgi:hypothetical protein